MMEFVGEGKAEFALTFAFASPVKAVNGEVMSPVTVLSRYMVTHVTREVRRA